MPPGKTWHDRWLDVLVEVGKQDFFCLPALPEHEIYTRGSQGYSGSQGYRGSQGLTGSSGSQGYRGSQGYSGSQGYRGSQGYTGFSGSQGYRSLTDATVVCLDGPDPYTRRLHTFVHASHDEPRPIRPPLDLPSIEQLRELNRRMLEEERVGRMQQIG